MVNPGFNCIELDSDVEIFDSIDVVVAAPTQPYSGATLQNMEAFYNRGGNLALFVEPESAASWTVFCRSFRLS